MINMGLGRILTKREFLAAVEANKPVRVVFRNDNPSDDDVDEVLVPERVVGYTLDFYIGGAGNINLDVFDDEDEVFESFPEGELSIHEAES